MPADRTQLRAWIPSALSCRLTRHAIAAQIAPWKIVRDALTKYLDAAENAAPVAPLPERES
jgi:hypothetical protein